ncbi:hypothetical protein Z946_3117 [Sulfitobacter noctilucicola]|uniref:Cyclic di-GMP-binding protein n=1 Tax=Sulfitobacter noctilucicola TaxID=1342301 RepID=A0A7W6M8W1_9RHOB|nr:cellulose biosynthesis cyclic di-GMP-binding regulatory protein BcsB [Sulfitobacter noctilucicola]KIN64228.1 hypothetical protein Z946_3117 [Sulfitobacter noctilucicola]MBB4174604.1 hypothetical protein [Sulfitobacter noctilucicola]
MRIIGIGLLAFLLTGAALLFSSLDIWHKGVRKFTETLSGPQLAFETSAPLASASAAANAVMHRNNAANPIILSGLPAYQSAVFSLPIDARATAGTLQIDATHQVLAGVQGTLRIAINNTRRGELLLKPGEVRRSLRIDLTAEELASDRLVVSFSQVGDGDHAGCASNSRIQAVTEVETTSALYLTTDSPLESTRDRVLAWGDQIIVGWPAWLASEEQPRRLALGAELSRQGQDLRFVEDGASVALTTDGLRELLQTSSTDISSRTIWPMAVATTGANAGIRRFQKSTSWRTRYDLDDVENNVMPTTFDVDLTLGFLDDGAVWTVTTTLNNRILQMDRVPTGQNTYRAEIALPEDMHDKVNVIEVTAASSADVDGICTLGPELIAEMHPTSQLRGVGPVFETQTSAVKSMLSSFTAVGVVDVPSLSATEATVVSGLIAKLVPTDTKILPIRQTVNLLPFSRADLGSLAELDVTSGTTWIAYNPVNGEEIRAQPASAEVIAQLQRTPVAGIIIQTDNLLRAGMVQ